MSLKSYKQYLEDGNPQALVPVDSKDANGLNQFSGVFDKIVEDRPAEIRRLLQKSMSSGVFDGDPDLLAQAKQLHTKLSAGKMTAQASHVGKTQSMVSRPSHDDPSNGPVNEDFHNLKNQMFNYLTQRFQGLYDAQDLKFYIEAAIYWFAANYNSGQATELYSILSSSRFRPSRNSRRVEDEGQVVVDMYRELESKFA